MAARSKPAGSSHSRRRLYPQVGVAALLLLERFGVTAECPEEQTCCGQPMANSGCSPPPFRPRASSSQTVFEQAAAVSRGAEQALRRVDLQIEHRRVGKTA